MSEAATELDFDLLDDVLPGVISRNDNRLRDWLIGCRAVQMGPLVEYALQAALANNNLPRLSETASCQMSDELFFLLSKNWSTQTSKSTSMISRFYEFSRVPMSNELQDVHWIAYVQRLKHAAVMAGFSKDLARKLTGSFCELADNLWQHSERPESAIVGYRRDRGEFEFVIADSGVGVVSSLNQKPDFAGIADAGKALELALSLADTPFGQRTRRGEGYRTMFSNLTTLSGKVRVRSGDHGIKLDGRQISFRTRTTFQTVTHQGFIVSVACKP